MCNGPWAKAATNQTTGTKASKKLRKMQCSYVNLLRPILCLALISHLMHTALHFVLTMSVRLVFHRLNLLECVQHATHTHIDMSAGFTTHIHSFYEYIIQ